MPRRGVVALITTAAALVLLFSFKTPGGPTLAVSGMRSIVAVGQPPVVSAGPSFASGGSNTGNATGGTKPVVATPTPAAAKLANGQVTGPVVATPYGDVQVMVTISSGKITDIHALQLPSDRTRSQMIGQYAAPLLRGEALQAQSAQIDLVSGATYTSLGYTQSLQGALDQAHA